MSSQPRMPVADERDALLRVLKQSFGFGSFLPLQEEIIRDALAGRDVFAVLPTGGGKSLCFQLPALMRPGLTIVVSPLIALMKDQVDALQASGVPATFVNSSLEPAEARVRLQGLRAGRYRLLYVAPERLMLPDFLAELRGWNVGRFAIDEAHCISEWGHDFRPEYRQLRDLRRLFPQTPLMALTATATERVREDIVRLLGLHAPSRYVASFNRPNLTYRVIPKRKPFDQLLEHLQRTPDESGIVYCLSRKTAETLAERLEAHGIGARPYHAGLTAEQRDRHQEMFLRDEARVMCATIAFGMGINKPNVRFVVHYDLPRNVEAYYQETGRAGRDGLPAECLLLFRPSDAVQQQRFIEEKTDPQERRTAHEQLQRMIDYAESARCRRADLLRYFGETFPDEPCGGCDNCLSPRETFDATVAAQKLLSCVYRVRERSGFSVGLGHIVEVLTGASTERVRKWGHETLSTYGIGTELSRPEWSAIGRELVRLGYLRQAAAKLSVVELTEEGRTFLRQRGTVVLSRPVMTPDRDEPRAARAGDGYDAGLFDDLRRLRKRLADERGVPAYIVFSDAALRQMAREYPTDAGAFGRISGVGEEKLRAFGDAFVSAVAAYLKENPRRSFASDVRGDAAQAFAQRRVPGDSYRETLRRIEAGRTPEEVAGERGLALSTVYGHLAALIEAGEATPGPGRFFTPDELAHLTRAVAEAGPVGTLTELRTVVGEEFDFNRLRLFRAFVRRGLA